MNKTCNLAGRGLSHLKIEKFSCPNQCHYPHYKYFYDRHPVRSVLLQRYAYVF